MKILIDTSIIIDFLRQKNKEKSIFYQLVSKNHDLFISILTHAELYSGESVWKVKKASEELETILDGLKIVPLTTNQSLLAGEIRAKYHIDLVDAIIAAAGVIEKLPLSTLNKKHFEKIKSLELFQK